MSRGRSWQALFAEFLVIVVGVLAALAVDQWRDALSDRSLEQQYLARLEDDLGQGRVVLDSLRLAHAGAARNADFVSPYLLGDSGMPGDTATTLAALYRASRSLAPSFASTFPMTTFLELQSTGRLGLIQDPGVRAALLHYYREIAATGVNLDLLPREYRDFIRRRLPTAIQLSVRSECPVQGTAQNEPLQCSIPLGDFDPRPLLREVEGNVSLAGDLNFSRQQLAIGLGLQAALIERTDELAELVIAAR